MLQRYSLPTDNFFELPSAELTWTLCVRPPIKDGYGEMTIFVRRLPDCLIGAQHRNLKVDQRR